MLGAQTQVMRLRAVAFWSITPVTWFHAWIHSDSCWAWLVNWVLPEYQSHGYHDPFCSWSNVR
jgi:hypothetical protein